MDDQPQAEVEVFSPTTWGGQQGYPEFHVVRYPDRSCFLACRLTHEEVAEALAKLSDACTPIDVLGKIEAKLYETIPGREYIVDTETLNRHFEMLPQTLRVQAWGGVYERPMKKQVALDAQIEAGDALTECIDTDPEHVYVPAREERID